MSTQTKQTNMESERQEQIAIDEDGEVTLPVVEVLTGRAFLTGKSGAVCDLFAVQRGEINLANVSSDTSEQSSLADFEADAEDDDDEKWILWATNSDSLSEENIMAHGMLYRVRWSIETSYRVIKEHFKASTTSITDAIRIFVWKLAMLFYNAWLLLRILLRDKGMVVQPGETAVRTHSFQRFLETDYG